MATPTAKPSILKTPKFRVSFPEVFRMKQFDPTQKPRFSIVGLFTPAEFTDSEKLKWKAILAACDKVARDDAKKSYEDLKAANVAAATNGQQPPYKLPFHKGEGRPYAGYGPGIIYFTMATYNKKPDLIDLSGNTITDEDEFYPGCYARASVNPYWFDNKGKGIAIGLNNLQKIADGERLDSRTSAAEDFGDDASEYGGGSDEGGDFEDDPTA